MYIQKRACINTICLCLICNNHLDIVCLSIFFILAILYNARSPNLLINSKCLHFWSNGPYFPGGSSHGTVYKSYFKQDRLYLSHCMCNICIIFAYYDIALDTFSLFKSRDYEFSPGNVQLVFRKSNVYLHNVINLAKYLHYAFNMRDYELHIN